jgi:hypothetical protein
MGYPHSHLSAANAVSADRFLNSVDMLAGPYTLDQTTIAADAGARHVTIEHTLGGNVDTLGTVDLVGTDLSGNVITETVTPVDSTTVASTQWFKTLTSATGVGWVVSVDTTEDTIEIGYGIDLILVDGTGTLHSVVVNTTAAGAITLADGTGEIAVLKASIAEGSFVFEALFYNYLSVTLAAASDITIMRDDNHAKPYAM